MNSSVASGAPTPALTKQFGVRAKADEDFAVAALDLGMTFQTEIWVAFHQHFPIDRPVRGMTDGASLTQGFMLEDKRPGLFAVALGAVLVEPSHRQPPCGFKDVGTVRIVALNAIHSPLEDSMMLGQTKLGMRLQMAGETRRRVVSGIYDELSASPAGRNMFAARSMAGFAPSFTGQFRILNVHPAMGAGRKAARDVGMAIVTGLISHV